jgi:hypothetical protein
VLAIDGRLLGLALNIWIEILAGQVMLKPLLKLATILFFAGPVAVAGLVFFYHWYVVGSLGAGLPGDIATGVSHFFVFGSWLDHALAFLAIFGVCFLLAWCLVAARRRLDRRRDEA